MMTNRWKQRGLALMAVLALAVPAAGMDSDPMDVVELYEPQLSYTDDAEPVEEQEDAWLPVEPDDPDMYDPVYNPEYADPEYVAPANDVLSSEETDILADENAPDAGEPVPEQVPPETTDTEGIAAAPVPDGGEATAENAEKAEGEAPAENPEDAGDETATEAPEKAGDETATEAPEKAGGEAPAETSETAEGETVEKSEEIVEKTEENAEKAEEIVEKAAENAEASETVEGEKAGQVEGETEKAEKPEGEAEKPEGEAEKPEGEAEKTEKPEGEAEGAGGEAVPASSGQPSPTPAPAVAAEASEVVTAEAEAAPKIAAEAAPTLTFPTAKLFMGKGERAALTAQLTDAPGVTVSYSSNRKNIVSVDAAGNLRARKKGVAIITATASNGLTASCTVKVVKAPSRLKLGNKKLTFGLGETRTLTAKLPKGTASAITWTSANPAVVTVDAVGNLTGVAAGTAKVTARTFNGKRATCSVTILGGKTPTTLTFPSATIKLGNKEKRQLNPQLGAGEAAIFTYSSSNKRVVGVNAKGMLTAKKKGTARITVKTHNGLKYRLTVKVVKAPGKLTISNKNISMRAGEATTVKFTLPSGTASALTWESSDSNIAAVDDGGNVVAISPGTVTLTARTFNGKSAVCTLTVVPNDGKNTPPGLSNAQMAANLRASTALGSKRQNLGDVAELLMDNGFSPAFAAGVVANIYSEGSYGKLESSNYGITSGNIELQKKRPKYFCYLDGGTYYNATTGNIQFVSPEEKAQHPDDPAYLVRYGDENYYLNNWSSKYVYDCDLNLLQDFIDKLTENIRQDGVSFSHDWKDGKMWHGKFGMGCTQWTGGRTRKLMALYHKYAGAGNPTITKAQVIAAEHEMILYDLTGDYKKVYTEWLNANDDAKYCPEAAYSAGSLVCLKYEIPANKETSAVKRGNNASKFYKIMVGAA